MATKLLKLCPVEPVFGLYTLGYSRNMMVQHCGLCATAPTPPVDVMKKRLLFSGDYTLIKKHHHEFDILFLAIDLPKSYTLDLE